MDIVTIVARVRRLWAPPFMTGLRERMPAMPSDLSNRIDSDKPATITICGPTWTHQVPWCSELVATLARFRWTIEPTDGGEIIARLASCEGRPS